MDKLRNSKEILKSKLIKVGKVLSTTFCEFCESSSVNGVQYITERGLHWSERIFWIIAVAVSLWMCGTLIYNTWVDWRDNLTIMKVEEDSSISTIPFPTVTICPRAKTTKDKFDLASKFKSPNELLPNLSATDYSRLNALSHLCKGFHEQMLIKNNYIDESIYDTLEELAPPLDHVLKECRWQSKSFDCSKYFVPVVTNYGVCFSFNALNPHNFYTNEVAPKLKTAKNNPNVVNWEWDSGYKGESVKNEYPLRVAEPGPDAGLEISLVAHEQDQTRLCDVNEDEFVVIISAPFETLGIANLANLRVVPISTNSLVSMEPVMTTTTESIRSYRPNERDCFYNSERRLAYFKVYSKRNCAIECVANYTLLKIGCVPFHSPSNKDTKICGEAFIKYNKGMLANAYIDYEFVAKCNCLYSCTSLEYVPKMDSVKFNMSALNQAKGFHANDSGIKISKMAVFFKDRQLKMIKRMETSTYADFLAICGGLLGLFLGMTTLSVIEIAYYLSLRLFWNVRNLCAQNSVAPIDLDEAGPSNVENSSSQQMSREKVKLSRAMKGIAIEFCDNRCFHGVQYITERGLHWMERILWYIAIIISFGVCGYLTRNIWMEWSENPVTIVPGKDALVYSIPHPTITICPETKTLKHKFDISSALKKSNKLSGIEQDQLKALAHVCPVLADQLQYTDKYAKESIFDTITNLSVNSAESTFLCNFLGISDCTRHLIPVLTDEGLCFTFNNLNSHDIYTDAMAPGMMIVKGNPSISGWSLDSGYTGKMTEKRYPRMTELVQAPISVMAFSLNKSSESQCKDVDEGFKVILTMPGDPLDMSRNYYRAPISKYTLLVVSAKIIKSSNAVRRYSPNQRQCFYSSERQLKFFKSYTENNCKAECLANFTNMECGCVKFSMPRSKETKICGQSNIMCYRLAEKNLRVSESAEYFRSNCNCMPTCTSIEYTAAFRRVNIDQKYFEKRNEYYKGRAITMFGFSIMIKSKVMNRKETYSWAGFLSICGGFLGLFLGMSALSVIEVIYYSTLRLFWRYRRLKSEANANPATLELFERVVIQRPIVQRVSEEIEIDDLSLESL